MEMTLGHEILVADLAGMHNRDTVQQLTGTHWARKLVDLSDEQHISVTGANRGIGCLIRELPLHGGEGALDMIAVPAGMSLW
jgi:hypothetical protein